MTFHQGPQGPQGLEIKLVYGPHALRVLLQDPILLFVDATERILQRVFQGDTIEIAPVQKIPTLYPRSTNAERLNAALAVGRTDPLEPLHA